ncbi:MAG: nicotinate-nucleotide adenylyltransferase [Clostridiales Family XIII bacterium]|jgi:nicotinate-nucleotide adenylyltransferase|nr:nicotinate-nucleotide adenylyltransferase [Clostridiales Family XIII bacterium]
MRIGVLGGSFDPLHLGHLTLAENARVSAGLSKVLFMPASIQPFKQDMRFSPDDERVAMIEFAARENPYFELSWVELERGGVSYTIDSLRELRAGLPAGDELAFILGTDMFLMVEKWHRSGELLREFGLIVGTRPGYRDDEVSALAEKLRSAYGTRIDMVGSSAMLLSASEIRKRLTQGESIRYLVPEDVRCYLLVRAKENPSRWEHTKRVMDFAAELAARYGENVYRAKIAALLHDYCKDSSGGVENNLTHGALAAQAAAGEFGISDEDVLNAIRYHTTGRENMSRLEMILFIADTLAPGRTYSEAAQLRELARKDLRVCTLAVLIELKRYLAANGYDSSRDSEDAIKWLEQELTETTTR